MANALGKRRSSGFSMIEVLVTLVLISIGVLGMVALQARTIQYTQDAVQRNTAAMLANDLVELMRAMPDGLDSFYKTASATFPDLPAAGCTPLPADAAGQLSCWAERAKSALPGASDLLNSEFYICRTTTANTCSGSGDAIEIQLAWQVRSGDCMAPQVVEDEENEDSDSQVVCHYRLRTQI